MDFQKNRKDKPFSSFCPIDYVYIIENVYGERLTKLAQLANNKCLITYVIPTQ